MSDVRSPGEVLRAAREEAGLSLAAMAARTHYSKSYLGLVETGDRKAASALIDAYETTLGVALDVDRRTFITAAAATALAPSLLCDDVAASIAGRDPNPLLTVQTSYADDMGVACGLDHASVRTLQSWMTGGASAILRVNAAGVLAKIPGQPQSEVVTDTLERDPDVRERYLIAVANRVLGGDWRTATEWVRNPTCHPNPTMAASRFAREVQNPRDAGARWCSAVMLQKFSPLVGRGPE